MRLVIHDDGKRTIICERYQEHLGTWVTRAFEKGEPIEGSEGHRFISEKLPHTTDVCYRQPDGTIVTIGHPDDIASPPPTKKRSKRR